MSLAGAPVEALDAPEGVGADLRALRKSRGVTLQEAAGAVGRSVGWLSQVERDMAAPRIDDLRRLARLYAAPLSLLFRNAPGPEHERAHIVRAGARRPVHSADGLREELLSPDLGGAFEVIRSVFASGAALEAPVLRETEEAGYVISGALSLMIGSRWHTLEPGDSFRFAAEPYQWRNDGPAPCVVIWIVSPPTY